jgi:dihydroorotase
MDLSAILRCMTVNPAAILRVPGGRLAIGAEADVTVFDPDEAWMVDPDLFASKGRNTPFAGHEVKGRVKYTIVGGKIVYQEG